MRTWLRPAAVRVSKPFKPRYSWVATRLTCDLSEVVLGDPRVPVTLESRLSDALGLELAKRPLVNDLIIVGGREERRGDPRLKDKPLCIGSAREL